MIGISIAIPTCNRADILHQTLEGLRALDLTDAGEFEIIVIDNASTDHTAKVANEHSTYWNDRLRCVREDRLGLNFARNRAITEARFDVVAYLDDDVDVDPRWLSALRASHEKTDCAAIGGRAHLVFPFDRPKWLGERDEGYLTKVELGDERCEVQPDQIYGVNFSVRREWVRKVGGFRTNLGRIGGGLMGGDELELLERISRAGGKLMYEPRAIVGHRVDPHRLTRRWFWKRCYDGHRGDVLMMQPAEMTLKEILRTGWHLTRAVARESFAAIKSGPRSEAFFHESLTIASKLGRLRGLVVARFKSPARGTSVITESLEQVPG